MNAPDLRTLPSTQPTSPFPRTPRTWIEMCMERGTPGMAEVNHHLMRLYSEPLGVYLRVSRWRTLGDPADLVAGFFADRLSREEFLRGWRASGKPLRRWLVNGLVFYLKELARGRRRDGRLVELETPPVGSDPSPEEALDRAFAVSLVRAALASAREDLATRGLEAHFEVFHEHEWNDVPYAELGGRLGVTAARARVMARTARDAFRRALRGLVARDGGSAGVIDDEIRHLLEALS